MFLLLAESSCSPEEFGALIGVSGMTFRRWATKPRKGTIPKLYVPAIRDACYQLISQGRIRSDSLAVQAILAEAQSNQYSAALFNLGLAAGFSVNNSSQDEVLLGLSKIGSQERKKTEVDENQKKVFSFKRLGEEWTTRINTLWAVIQSKKLTSMDKLVAYGALFYLLTPIDFIPDSIPFFGLLDDFGVLGIAVTYYTKRYSGTL